MASRQAAQTLGLPPLGEFVSYGQVAGPTPSLLQQPANAINAALAHAKLTLDDLDVLEISEAFAAVALASVDAEQVKPLWPTLLEAPVRIDSPAGTPASKDEEYIYWAN